MINSNSNQSNSNQMKAKVQQLLRLNSLQAIFSFTIIKIMHGFKKIPSKHLARHCRQSTPDYKAALFKGINPMASFKKALGHLLLTKAYSKALSRLNIIDCFQRSQLLVIPLILLHSATLNVIRSSPNLENAKMASASIIPHHI